MGAKLIEKHFCFDNLETVDSFFSMNPIDFKKMVSDIRDVEKAIGSISYNVSESAKQSLNGRRSIYVSENIKKGEIITSKNIKCIRPSHGLEPKYFDEVIGKKAVKDLFVGDRLSFKALE